MLADACTLSPQQVADAPKRGKRSFGDGALRSILLASLAHSALSSPFGITQGALTFQFHSRSPRVRSRGDLSISFTLRQAYGDPERSRMGQGHFEQDREVSKVERAWPKGRKYKNFIFVFYSLRLVIKNWIKF